MAQDTKSTTVYDIKEGDCLSIISERYGIPINTLMSLNSEQIKNPDLIYTGNKLVLVDSGEESAQSDGSRIPTVDAPEQLLHGDDTCSVEKPFPLADVLYVPAHPKSGKKYWYGITSEAKELILKEKSYLDNAIDQSSVKKTTEKLIELGILSKFMSTYFEQFMNEEEVIRYKTLLYFKMLLTRHDYKQEGKNPFVSLYQIAQNTQIDITSIDSWKDEYYALLDFQTRTKALILFGKHHINDMSWSEAYKEMAIYRDKIKQKKLDRLYNELLEEITDTIEDMEEASIKRAESSVSDDGTKFVFNEELKYFTSKRQEKIKENLEDHIKDYKEADIATQNHEQALKTIKEFIKSSGEPEGYWFHNDSLKQLNNLGYVIKEQCLTLDQLEGSGEYHQGPKVLKKMKNWRTLNKVIDITDDTFISDLYTQCGGPQNVQDDLEPQVGVVNRTIYAWSYYPTLALIKLIDATIKRHRKNLTEILKGSAFEDEIFSKLLWVKKFANVRLNILKKAAQNRLDNQIDLEFVPSGVKELPKKLVLLWKNEYKRKPQNTSGFINKAGLNDLQVVECSLMSTGELFYLRGPCWYMPEMPEKASNKQAKDLCLKSKGHVIDITSKIKFKDITPSGKGMGKTLRKAMEKALKEDKIEVTGEIVKITAEAKYETKFWSDEYHYHTQGGASPDNTEGQYNIDAGAQFMRFTAKATGALNSSLSDYKKLMENPLMIGASGEIGAQFDLVRAQASLSYWLPLGKGNQPQDKASNKIKGYELSFNYVNKEDKPKTYPIGLIACKISGSAYGLVAASCVLSGKLVVGASDSAFDQIGVRGSNISILDPNVRNMNVLNSSPRTALGRTNIATERGVTVDVFAGVQAGGSFGASVYWKPPQEKYQELGTINGDFSARAGAGFGADYRLIIEGGILIFVAGQQFTLGLGLAGKLAININTINVDRFVSMLLGVLKMHDYKRLTLFGEVDGEGINKDFEKLNNALTFAIIWGMKFVDILLLPVNMWAEHQQNSLGREYGPMLTSRIIDEEYQTKTQPWLVKAPPETLCGLLNCLILEQTKPVKLTDGTELYSVEVANQRQAQAIVQIMEWLEEDQKNNLSSKKQWKETLIRMNDDPFMWNAKPFEWASFKDNWFKLAMFVDTFGRMEGLTTINRFNESSIKLSKNMILTYIGETTGQAASTDLNKQDNQQDNPSLYYNAYPISVATAKKDKNGRSFIEVKFDGQVETKQEYIKEWTTDVLV